MLEICSWFIRNNLLILKKWNPYVNLTKEDVGNVPVLVKLHGVLVTAFSGNGLSVIATKLDTPLMFDSYTSDICVQSWDRPCYARPLIEIRADMKLKDTIVVAMAKLVGEGFYTCTILKVRVETSQKKKKSNLATRGVLVGPKVRFKPVKQVYRQVPNKNNVNTSERLIIDGKVTLVDDEGKPLTKVDYSGDHASEDKVVSVDNDIANFMASKKVGYVINSLLEQWKKSDVNGDYNFDPYDDDMYEG
ncbi:putative reverse transcriptase domain-containing protein [Tanacetum coccineum]